MQKSKIPYLLYLHSTMYLLKLSCYQSKRSAHRYLHSTMYLLKRNSFWYFNLKTLFTFHHVSIKTCKPLAQVQVVGYLHSTMYLLKLRCHNASKFLKRFTFHHVSIKTTDVRVERLQDINLHSTMYLLKPAACIPLLLPHVIYIPPCIY